MLIICDLILLAYACCKRGYKFCQENNNVQNEIAVPLVDEAIIPPDPHEAELMRFRDLQRANERNAINARQAEEKYNAEHPQLDNRILQNLEPHEREQMERFREDEKWQSTLLAIHRHSAENRVVQHDQEAAALGDLDEQGDH